MNYGAHPDRSRGFLTIVPEHPLHVLLVVEPGVDGVFRHVEQLAQFLLATPGIVVHLAYSSVRGSPDLHRLVSTLQAHGQQTLDLRTSNTPSHRDIRTFMRLRAFTRRLRPDVIHAHSSKAGVLARALAFTGVKARYFYTPHAYYRMADRMTLKKRFFIGIERLLAGTGVTLHVSASEADYARRELGVHPGRQRIILNSVDGDRYRPPADAAEKLALRRHFRLPPDAPIIGTVARYTAQKDPQTLYRAVIASLSQTPHLHFAHVGEGEGMPQVAEQLNAAPSHVRDRVIQLKRCDEMPMFYRMLDTFVLPSTYEGLSLALLEALATGLPMILTDCPGNRDLKQFGADGIQWINPGEADQLAAYMSALAAGPPRPNNHRQMALKLFNRTQGCRDILRCYTLPQDPPPECPPKVR